MMTGAKTVFEMGSAVGYSTIWWARAVGEAGTVHYTDSDNKNAEQARRYFQRAGVADRIKIHIGDAIELLSEQKEEFDIVFNDIDKEDYPASCAWCLRGCAKAACLSRQRALERPSRAANPDRSVHQGDPGVQPPALQLARVLHHDPADPRWRCGGGQGITDQAASRCASPASGAVPTAWPEPGS